MEGLKLESSVFQHETEMPRKYGYKEENVNPPLMIYNVPEGAKSLALVMDDPDAKEPAGKIWDHWVVWNIDPERSVIQEDISFEEAVEGKNDYGEIGYGGPNPPDKEHTYRFKLYALDNKLDLPEGSTKADLRKAMKGHLLDKTLLEGKYVPEGKY